MNFLCWPVTAGPSDTIVVTLDRQANVLLMDDMNYMAYRHGQSHRYFGGLAKQSPIPLTPPRNGRWHLVVDLGGRSGIVNATVSLC